jgi:3,4-dihydroxy 2-butanone 4-phosphate synthase/GTP cyclohydrolase II
VAAALYTTRTGGIILLVDAATPSRPGALLAAAQTTSAHTINFMTNAGRGPIRLVLAPDLFAELGIAGASARDRPGADAVIGSSIDARAGIGAGISSADRARTIAAALAEPRDLVQPGHVMVQPARAGGLLVHQGPREAAIDLPAMSGLMPAGVLCDVLDDDGEVAGLAQLSALGRRHALTRISIARLAAFRRRRRQLVRRVVSTSLPTRHGTFQLIGYRSTDGAEHLAFVHGDVSGQRDVCVSVHRECRSGDVFRSHACRCREDLDAALTMIARSPRGVLLYLTHRDHAVVHVGRAISALEHDACDQMLADLGPAEIRVLGEGAPVGHAV